MKVLRGVLTFVLGLVLGIVLFVVAIAGTLVALGTLVDVGQVQDALTDADIIQEDSELYSSSVLEAVKMALDDYHSLDKLSLKVLYEHYGINLLKGVSGIDFTQKGFYDKPLTSIVGDMSLLLNDLYLSDISKITKMDFTTYGIPILNENLNVGLTKALDNIMGSLNSDMTLRSIKDKFGLDLGAADNDMLAALQDISLKNFGSVIDALRIDTLLNADADSFLALGNNVVYVQADDYEVVSPADLANPDYKPKDGYETYIAGAVDGKLDVKELRYFRYLADGRVVVNNTCYNEGFSVPEGVEVVRHRLYRQKTDAETADKYYVVTYANRVATLDGASYTLLEKGFEDADNIYVYNEETPVKLSSVIEGGTVNVTGAAVKVEDEFERSPLYAIVDEEITKDSVLSEVQEPALAKFVRSHVGTSATLLQKINYLSIGELRDADSLLKGIKIGEIIDTTAPGTSKIVIALKDSTLDTIGQDINNLHVDDIFDTDSPDTALIMKSLANRHCTLNDLGSIADQLTIGELIAVDFDEYEPYNSEPTDEDLADPAKSFFVKVPVYVKYDPFAADMYGEGARRGDYDEESGVFSENGDGEYVETFYYTLYGKTEHKGMQVYTQTRQSDTAIAIQSLARRGCKMSDIGSAMDQLTISELLRIDNSSAHLFKTLARKGSKMSSLAGEIDDLKIDELIEIDSSSAYLMRSLAARGCTINDLSTITDELTLSEMIELKFDEYTPDDAGKYVLVEDENSYMPYAADSDMDWRHKYTKQEGGDFVPAALPTEEPLYVHSAYYTLYNAALHTTANQYVRKTEAGAVQRYAKSAVEDASSPVLQRFASSTLGSFSSAFGTLMISDVMDIDADVYGEIDKADIHKTTVEEGDGGKSHDVYYYKEQENNQTLFYYDADNKVYRVAEQSDLKEAMEGSKTLYVVTAFGSSTSMLKKIAFVNVQEMPNALDAVISDLMLGEIIDINSDYAVGDLQAYDTYSPDEESFYFIEWDGKTYSGTGEARREAVYVYDSQLSGKYFASDKQYIALSDEDLQGEFSTTTYYYEYKPLSDLKSQFEGQPDALKLIALKAKAVEMATKDANMFIYTAGKETESETYNRILPLAIYEIGHLASYSAVDSCDLYYRVKAEGPTQYSYTAYTNTNNKVYVEILGSKQYTDVASAGAKTPLYYDPENPAHADLPKFELHTSETKEFIVPISDSDYGYDKEKDLTLALQYCYPVYFLNSPYSKPDRGTDYVYVNGAYVVYDEGNPAHNAEDVQHFTMKMGYIAQFGEAFYYDVSDGRVATTALSPAKVSVIRERSSAVLRLLAQQTVKNMNGIIAEAKIGDFMDITPGTIFDNEQIQMSTLNDLGITLFSVFTNMTVGELLEWSNITTIQPSVASILHDVKIPDFFAGLQLDASTGNIVVDVRALYGLSKD